jgi:hypothetical protein
MLSFYFLKTKQTKRRKDMELLSSLQKTWCSIREMIKEVFNPRELSKAAHQTKFIQRSTVILQGKDFVELMTTASMDSKAVSLEGLCSELREINPDANITPQSLMEKINRSESVDFLKSVFYQAIEKGLRNIGERLPPDLLAPFNNVWLEDCSECVLNEKLQEEFKGSSGVTSKSCVKLDFIYEIKQRNIFSVDLKDRRSPDQKLAQRHLQIVKKGDLWIRDLGFFDVSVFKAMMAVSAFFLSRLPACVYVYWKKGDKEPIDLAKHINTEFPGESVIDIEVYITTEKLPVRLIAYRAPKEIAEKRRREANKEDKKKGRQRSKASLDRLDFTFFVTNVPKEIWKPEIVGTIYTVRWQVELIFKSWKSQLQINYLKGINPHRIKCLLYGKLILIVIINIIYKFCDIYAQKLEREISLHKLVNWLKRNMRIDSLIFQRRNYKFFEALIREIPISLSKKKRRRKTTQGAIEAHTNYCDLYVHLYGQYFDNELIKVA